MHYKFEIIVKDISTIILQFFFESSNADWQAVIYATFYKDAISKE